MGKTGLLVDRRHQFPVFVLTILTFSGPESIPKDLVQIALTSLQEEVTRVLPPINWAGLLTPLMRNNFGKTIFSLVNS